MTIAFISLLNPALLLALGSLAGYYVFDNLTVD